MGQKNQFLYCASMGNPQDPMAFDGLTKYNLTNDQSLFYPMKNNEMCGEPIFLSKFSGKNEDDGYVAYIGYNREKDESFLEILDARDLKFLARIWANCFLPLGFHGHYISKEISV